MLKNIHCINLIFFLQENFSDNKINLVCSDKILIGIKKYKKIPPKKKIELTVSRFVLLGTKKNKKLSNHFLNMNFVSVVNLIQNLRYL